MAELLFILVTLYVAYVVFKVVECEKQLKQAKSPVTAPPQVTVKSAVAPAAKQPAPAKTAPTEKTTATKSNGATTLKPGTLRNPKTGETSKIASNYRFLKRWIKEALVEEGLLEKIYKNTELNKETIATINEALEKLKTIAKYQ
jgi:hypothetical protein